VKPSPKAEKLARRIGVELGITITPDDPVIALLLFEEERHKELGESFKQSQLQLIKTITSALKVNSSKKKFDISLYLGIFNTFLLILLITLVILK